MYTLYARPGSGSFAIEALLDELGMAFKIVDILREADKSPPKSYFGVNPRGEVPALLLPDGALMTESAAILICLADLKPEAGLAPLVTDGKRADYLRWILYFASSVYMADLRFYYPERYSTDANGAAGVKAASVQHMDRDFSIFSEWLSAKDFILGQQFSAADIYAVMLITWAPDVPALLQRHPNLKAYVERVAARPHVAKALKRNNLY